MNDMQIQIDKLAARVDDLVSENVRTMKRVYALENATPPGGDMIDSAYRLDRLEAVVRGDARAKSEIVEGYRIPGDGDNGADDWDKPGYLSPKSTHDVDIELEPFPAPDDAAKWEAVAQYANEETRRMSTTNAHGPIRWEQWTPDVRLDAIHAAQFAVAKAIELGLAAPADPPVCPECNTSHAYMDWECRDTVRSLYAERDRLAADLAAERARVAEPDPEDMAETIAEWRDVLGSEGLARKIIETHWRAAERGEGN